MGERERVGVGDRTIARLHDCMIARPLAQKQKSEAFTSLFQRYRILIILPFLGPFQGFISSCWFSFNLFTYLTFIGYPGCA